MLGCLAEAGLLEAAQFRAPGCTSESARGAAQLSAADASEAAGAEAAGAEAAAAQAGALLGCWLEAAPAAYNARFHLASNRIYSGLTPAEEGEWCGPYDFVQLADPQLGMLHMDRSWAEARHLSAPP